MSDRLTDSAIRTLAALERRGRATCVQLSRDLGEHYDDTYASLEALAGGGFVADEPLADEEVNHDLLTPDGRPDLFAFKTLRRPRA